MPTAKIVETLKKYVEDLINRVRNNNNKIDDINNKIAAVKNDVKTNSNKIHIFHNTTTVAIPTTTTTTATTAPERVILITGGRTRYSGYLSSTEVYPEIKTCSTPSLPKKTAAHALFMTAGTTPRVAYCGGLDKSYRSSSCSSCSSSCVVWDSDNQRWDEHMMRPLPQKIEDHSVVTFENIGVYVMGGRGSNSKVANLYTFFLPANSLQWKRGPGLPKDFSTISININRGCAVPVSKNSFIYIFKGVIREYKIDIANPTSNQGWMPANRWPAISRRAAHTCARIGSYVLIAGGWGNGVGGLSSTKIIDITTRKVRLGGNLVTPRYNHNLATVTTGGLTKTFALGGNRSGGKYLSTVEEWDEDNLKWKPAGNLKVARSEFAAITVPLSVVCPGSG